MAIEPGWYENCTDVVVLAGPLAIGPHERVLVERPTDEARWQALCIGMEWALQRGLIQPAVMTESVGKAPEAEAEAEASGWQPLTEPVEVPNADSPYLRPDPEDARLFLSQSYQKIKAQLKHIDRYDLLGQYLRTATQMGKSEAIVTAIAARMEEIQQQKKEA